QLRGLTRDNPDQLARIGALESVTNGRIILVDQALARLRQGDAAGARQSLRDTDDLFHMHELIDGIAQTEDRLLVERTRDVEQQVSRGQFVLGLTALAQPLLLIGDGAWSDGALLQRLNDVLLRNRELWDYELVQRTVDGVDRHVVINARRIQQQDSDAQALLLTVSDVTARALAEQKVNELNHQLEGKVAQVSDVNRELEAFSYSVSHDLRAPLRHIAGFAR